MRATEGRPNSNDVDQYRYTMLIDAERRAVRLDQLARKLRSGREDPTDIGVEAIELFAQQVRQHRALVSMELARSRAREGEPETTKPTIPLSRGWWARLVLWFGSGR